MKIYQRGPFRAIKETIGLGKGNFAYRVQARVYGTVTINNHESGQWFTIESCDYPGTARLKVRNLHAASCIMADLTNPFQWKRYNMTCGRQADTSKRESFANPFAIMFDVGQQVVCVDATFPPGINDIFNALPRKGLSYIVRDIVPGVNWDMSGTCAVLLRDLENKPNAHGIEPGFAPHRFRELTPQEEREESHAEDALPLLAPVHINCRCTIVEP